MAENEIEAKRLSLAEIAKRVRHGDTVYFLVRGRRGQKFRKTFISVFCVWESHLCDITAHVGRVLDRPYDNKEFKQITIGNCGFSVDSYLKDELIKVLRLPANGLNIEEI